MSLGKLPGIKGLASGSQGKRRFKSELSVDMISPPLPDFRHTMHVGRGGDVFGDTSFLSNHGGKGEPASPDSPTSSTKTTRFFSRTLRHVRRSPVPRARIGSRDLSPPPPPVSPIIKNAISLPQLNIDMPNGYQRVLFPSSVSSPDTSLYSYGLQSGFVTLPRHSRLDKQLQDGTGLFAQDYHCGSLPDNDGFALTRSDSFTSFTVDLGPSLMSEVLGMIDSPSCLSMPNHSWELGEEEEEEEQSSVFELAVQSPMLSSSNPSMSSTPLKVNVNNRGRSCSSEWAEGEEEDERSLKTPDASMRSPTQVEPVMEAERFQRAADVLARHYGGGSFSRSHRSDSASSSSSSPLSQPKAPYAFPEEEEIKV
ncbi:cdc42 effector protein 1 [Salmo salar]|uniref:Cdc42 effector protein 1-like n=1 Tax=Salmo salar TaxID=8030 RepID=A0A1S3S4F3_SALSA|nr:cdc42 effector protein 1-like [Salmo salar]XP_014059258.1 cdc42 effector protein 1-like [Salmo salar]XP_014059260.1 cdc42 effector protein 1-like [Salmo salar]XP_045576388.1 cdc42 effector protein 1-like [Salmo salar]XP_045576389.1 cdc42 effector protein 1-like [Salmo salar]|eukprot:XP_014059255.1 PREDICTED: cdc42 effector protein 1-like [Salmo salar]